MRGDFENPPGMAEGERLFSPMNNLTAKGRPFVQGGDGMMLVSTQLTVDGKPMPRQGAPAPPPPGAGARTWRIWWSSRCTRPTAAVPRRIIGSKNARPGNGAIFVGSKGHMATTAGGEGVWLLPASRWAEYKLPAQLLQRGINHQQDWLWACKGGAAGSFGFCSGDKVHWVAHSRGNRVARPGKLMWDANKRRSANSDQPNRLLKPVLGKSWEVKL